MFVAFNWVNGCFLLNEQVLVALLAGGFIRKFSSLCVCRCEEVFFNLLSVLFRIWKK